MKKINFRQPKYILPLIAFLPLNFMAYEICEITNSDDSKKKYNDLNISMPEAGDREMRDKDFEMKRIGIGKGGVTGIMELEKEEKDTLQEKNVYTQDELDKINKANEQKKEVQEQLKALEQSLKRSQDKINGTARNAGSSRNDFAVPPATRADEMDSYAKEIEKLQSRAIANQRKILGLPTPEEEKSAQLLQQLQQMQQGNGQQSQTSANATKGKEQEEKTEVVEKVKDGSENFHTVGGQEAVDAALIKAMIDQQTKVHEGTRLRFKLLDDVEIQGMRLPKGTYLYGTVNGFGQQRVKASVTSILIRDKFIKVNLSVYDVDGMEGFYVPQSAFRDFMRNAGAQAVQQNMNFNNNGNSSSINAETVALQALQNLYSSATQAVSTNIRKNKAKIKYNSIVYLINAK